MPQDFADRIDTALASGRADEAVDLARAAASDGEADALLLLATWHLVGNPLSRDLPEARRLLRAAAAAGRGDARLMEVALTANGGFGVVDWAAARALLEALAPASPIARAHLQIVQQNDVDHQGFPLGLPERRTLERTPEVILLPGFCSPAECRHLAEAAIPVMEPSAITDPITGEVREHPVRTSHSAFIGPTRETLPIRAINLRIAAASSTEAAQGEPLVVLHYAPGQQYRAHLDTLPGARNQRIATVLIYLNDSYQGGETSFPELGLSIKGRLGDALLFHNTDARGRPDPRARHAGLPVMAGRKWLATRWIRCHSLEVWTRPD